MGFNGWPDERTISIRLQDLDQNSSTLQSVSSQAQDLDKLAVVLPPDTICAMTRDRLDQIALRKWCFNNRFAPYPQP